MLLQRISSNVPNWEATINKVATSKEGDLVGNVEATDESAVLVSSGGDARFIIEFQKTW